MSSLLKSARMALKPRLLDSPASSGSRLHFAFRQGRVSGPSEEEAATTVRPRAASAHGAAQSGEQRVPAGGWARGAHRGWTCVFGGDAGGACCTYRGVGENPGEEGLVDGGAAGRTKAKAKLQKAKIKEVAFLAIADGDRPQPPR